MIVEALEGIDPNTRSEPGTSVIDQWIREIEAQAIREEKMRIDAQADKDRKAEETRAVIAKQEEQRESIAIKRENAIDVEPMEIAAVACGYALAQMRAARKKIKSTRVFEGATTAQLAALGMVRMSEAEKHGWVNPENPKRGDKPKVVMVPYVGDPSLQHGASHEELSAPMARGGGVLYSSSRSLERCVRPCVSPSAQDLVKMLNNAHGRRICVDKRWADRRSLQTIKGPVHQIFNYEEHNLIKYDQLTEKGMALRFLDLKDKDHIIRRYIIDRFRKDDYDMVSREITKIQRKVHIVFERVL